MRKRRIKEIRDGVLYLSCAGCGEMMPEESYSRYKNKTGKYYSHSLCRKCAREYDRKHSAKKRAKQTGVSEKEVLESRELLHLNAVEQKQLLREVNELYGGIDNIPDQCADVEANICFDCKNAIGNCSWSEVDLSKRGRPIKFQPVDGWEAEIVYRKGNGGTIVKTYSIKSCPQFIQD